LGVLDLGRMLYVRHMLETRARQSVQLAARRGLGADELRNHFLYGTAWPAAGARAWQRLHAGDVTVQIEQVGTAPATVRLSVAMPRLRAVSPWMAGWALGAPVRVTAAAERP
jgi:hypothetical protein